MRNLRAATFARLRARFAQESDAGVATTFALALIPFVASVGMAVDYSRANAVKTVLQSALDSAVLAAAADGTSNWSEVAHSAFRTNFGAKTRAVDVPTPAFTATISQEVFTGSASVSVPASFLGIIGTSSIAVGAKTVASVTEADDSCILTLDKGQPLSHVSLSLNGAPVINLSGCTIRSNTALDCNGHDGNVTKAIASGTASGCTRPKSHASVVPDVYAAKASNITTECGTQRPGVTWEGGSIPTGPGVKKVSKAGYTEYHICGDLTLTGTGSLTGDSPSSDSVIIIENGRLNIDNHAAITTKRTAIVMTGTNAFDASINFPNGNGHSASLTLSPPIDPANPWQAVALYQDPKLTNNVHAKWGPGATFHADGLVYLGNSNVVTDGNTASSNSRCTKFVMNQFTTNGSIRLDFAQTNCAVLGLKQWGGRPVRLIQ